MNNATFHNRQVNPLKVLAMIARARDIHQARKIARASLAQIKADETAMLDELARREEANREYETFTSFGERVPMF